MSPNQMNVTHTAYLSLGSNLGDALNNLQEAVFNIQKTVGEVQRISPIYKTESWGFDSDDFMNLCISVNTELSPQELLHRL
ncbi:MAG: 2-amino-4-hydroxy-6-hydroxymethyldihydropteridine diphosphokinase, partial [Pricia sp.]|nr:2-amino-4-hydroxy-6-hydroxymethyldihydropteridine diphosphokinase [Pricia sp.]